MKKSVLLLFILSATAVACGVSETTGEDRALSAIESNLGLNPGLSIPSYSGAWYITVEEAGETPDTLNLEISGRGVFSMSRTDWATWHTYDSGVYPLPIGTSIRLLAYRTVSGVVQTATYGWFAYGIEQPRLVEECTPTCTGRVCGADGCGGVCGTCAAGETCTAAGACLGCVPACAGRQCGADGCGGVCGTCAGGATCTAEGTCQSCTPSCTAATCGSSDGCGGTCPACPPAGNYGSGTLGDGPIPANCPPLSGVLTSVAKGTYCVNGDIVVPAGTTLMIPPGTTFIFMGAYHFGYDSTLPDDEVRSSGTIWAIGTAAEPIVFRGATPETGWFGIVLYHAHDRAHFEYVTIRDTHKSDTNVSSRIWRQGGGLNSYVTRAGTILRHCSFINNRARSIAGALYINSHAVWPDRGPIEITNSLFERNSCDCYAYVSSSTDLCGGGAVRFAHIGGDEELIKIRDNLFSDNHARLHDSLGAYGGAIAGFDASVILGPGNVFTNNSAATTDGAVSCGGVPNVGLVLKSIDASVTFTGNTPNNGCGR